MVSLPSTVVRPTSLGAASGRALFRHDLQQHLWSNGDLSCERPIMGGDQHQGDGHARGEECQGERSTESVITVNQGDDEQGADGLAGAGRST